MTINNNNGVALLFVITAITILTIILTDFSFETQINKLRTYNSQDKLQARLNAEAGLNLALIRLELYQKARNLIEKRNKTLPPNTLESINAIWSIPFIYPFPLTSQANLEVKAAIEKFMSDTVLEGEVLTEIRNISNLINLNLLRINRPRINGAKKNNPNDPNDRDDHDFNDRDKNKMIFNLEDQLVSLFRQKFDKKLQQDDEFFIKYNSTEPHTLIKEIKFFINDEDTRFEPETEEIRNIYRSQDIHAKHAPLESLSELYLLNGWNDELVDMIQNEVTVHGVVSIDLNKITEQGLKLLIPEMSDEEVKDFFEYRDDPTKPNFFTSLENFIHYIVSVGKILTKSEMEKRIDEFIESGINFGILGSLFQVTSTGRHGRAEYTIKAFVEIPIKPNPPPPPPKKKNDSSDSPNTNPDKNSQEKEEKKKKKQPIEFLRPRVVEITIY